jgi:methionyl-tRNA formyltransferase
MRIVFMGSPEFAVPSLYRLLSNGYEVIAVYTQPDRPAGRGKVITFSPVKRAALGLGLNIIQPVKLKSLEEIERFMALKPDVVVVAAFGQILPKEFLEVPLYGCINIHPSLLPRHRGASPIASAILAGDEFTGISIMKMDVGMDTGPVISRAQIPIGDEDTTGSLTEKLSIISASLVQDVLIHWVRGELKAGAQNEGLATYTVPVNKNEGEINWQRPVTEIWRQIRAFQPWPGAFTRWHGKRLEIIQGFPLSLSMQATAGQVLDLLNVSDKAAFAIGTRDGLLGVNQVQLEGKAVISAKAFRNGQRDFINTRLPS